MSHPSLGLPPLDESAGYPVDAAALRRFRSRIATRALEAARDVDPTFVERHDELQLRELLADLEAMVSLLATSIAANEPAVAARWAEMVAVRYRKRRVPMDDVVTLCEGLRRSCPTVVTPTAMPAIDASLDAAIAVFRWHRRLAGDARKRNPLAMLIYKGA